MLSLLFRKNSLLAIAVVGAFAYPMFRNGELSLSKIAGWVGGDSESPPEYDPFYQPPVSPTFRPASLSSNGPSTLPGSLDSSPVTALPQTQSSPTVGNQISQFLGSLFETQTIDASGQIIPQTPAPASSPSTAQTDPGLSTALPTPSTEPQLLDLREIIRFDVRPAWVQQRWQRVSAAPVSDEGFQGLRVPLNAGPGPLQMTGVLTYYFDRDQILQRIQFLGTTNQADALEQLCRTYFRFQPIDDMPGVFAPVHDNQPRGLLKRTVPVILDQNRGQLSQVALEINSTRGPYQLSEMMRQLALQ